MTLPHARDCLMLNVTLCWERAICGKSLPFWLYGCTYPPIHLSCSTVLSYRAWAYLFLTYFLLQLFQYIWQLLFYRITQLNRLMGINGDLICLKCCSSNLYFYVFMLFKSYANNIELLLSANRFCSYDLEKIFRLLRKICFLKNIIKKYWT